MQGPARFVIVASVHCQSSTQRPFLFVDEEVWKKSPQNRKGIASFDSRTAFRPPLRTRPGAVGENASCPTPTD